MLTFFYYNRKFFLYSLAFGAALGMLVGSQDEGTVILGFILTLFGLVAFGYYTWIHPFFGENKLFSSPVEYITANLANIISGIVATIIYVAGVTIGFGIASLL